MAAQGNEVAVAWLEDCRDDHAGNDVYLDVSSDAGLDDSVVVTWEERLSGRSWIKLLPGRVKSE